MQVFDNLHPGDTAEWQSIRGPLSGTVLSVDEKGVHVACKRGGQVLLTTRESYKNFIERIGRRSIIGNTSGKDTDSKTGDAGLNPAATLE